MTKNQCTARCYLREGHGGTHDVYTQKDVDTLLKVLEIKRKYAGIPLRDFIEKINEAVEARRK